jgi:hypothetical protein
MAQKFIDIEALNLRSSPNSSSSANRIGTMFLGHEVDEIGPAPVTGWTEIKTTIDGTAHTGMVKSEINGVPSLRDPVDPAREALVAQAIKEWLRFERGQGLEHHSPFYKFVGEMWEAIGSKLNGTDRGVPWSAAAISFMVRNAAATVPKYKDFKFAAAHAKYMHDSIVQRGKKNNNAPFWGYQLWEKRPEIGDIACKWRVTRRDYADAKARDDFTSHSDIIVSIRNDHVLAVGGNVNHSVSISRYEKTPVGFLAKTNRKKSGVFMIMVNQA